MMNSPESLATQTPPSVLIRGQGNQTDGRAWGGDD